jgi:hypothetical protein
LELIGLLHQVEFKTDWERLEALELAEQDFSQ